MEKFNKVLCIGAAHIDYTFSPLQPLKNKTSNPIQSTINYGGVIRNVSENLSRLEVDVSLMSMVGKDMIGNQLIHDMSLLMNINAMSQVGESHTGQYYAVLDRDGDMDIAYADMSIYERMNDVWIKENEDIIRGFDLIVADMNIQKSGIEMLIKLANLYHKRLIIVGVSEPKMKHLPDDLNGVDCIICNLKEAKTYHHLNQIDHKSLINLWKKTGVNQVIMTNGTKDVLYLSPSFEMIQKKVHPLNPKQIKNATGAGDAFSAGVVYGIVNGLSIESSMTYGVANAKLTIQSQGSVNHDLTINQLLTEVNNDE